MVLIALFSPLQLVAGILQRLALTCHMTLYTYQMTWLTVWMMQYPPEHHHKSQEETTCNSSPLKYHQH